MQKNFRKTIMSLAFLVLGSTTTAVAGTTDGCVVAGPDNAAVTIEEFADFECSYCVRGSNTMKDVLKDYAGKVKLVFRNMPLPAHPTAMIAAQAFAAVCLQSPTLAYAYQAALFENQDKFVSEGEPYLYSLAQKLGVDVDQMKTDMNGDQVAKSIARDNQLAQAHNFKGTPSFMIGTEPVQGAYPYDQIKSIIDKQLGQ